MKANKRKFAIAMAKACITRNDLAEKSGVGLNQTKKMLSGENVRPITFGKVCKALGVEVEELLDESEV